MESNPRPSVEAVSFPHVIQPLDATNVPAEAVHLNASTIRHGEFKTLSTKMDLVIGFYTDRAKADPRLEFVASAPGSAARPP